MIPYFKGIGAKHFGPFRPEDLVLVTSSPLYFIDQNIQRPKDAKSTEAIEHESESIFFVHKTRFIVLKPKSRAETIFVPSKGQNIRFAGT
jgi:hypothetical protein